MQDVEPVCMPCGCMRIVCRDERTCHGNRFWDGGFLYTGFSLVCLLLLLCHAHLLSWEKQPPQNKTTMRMQRRSLWHAVLPDPTQDSIVKEIFRALHNTLHHFPLTSITKIILSGKSAAQMGPLLFTTSFEKALSSLLVEADQQERGKSRPWLGGGRVEEGGRSGAVFSEPDFLRPLPSVMPKVCLLSPPPFLSYWRASNPGHLWGLATQLLPTFRSW